MAFHSPSRCTAHQLSRSLRPRSPLAFRNRSVSGPCFFSEPPAPKHVSVRSQTPGPDMFRSRPSTSFDDSDPSIVSPTTSSAIDFLTLCRRLKTTKRKGWINHGTKSPESIADHMNRMALMSLIATDLHGVDKESHCYVTYDLGLDLITIVGDITPSDGVPKEEKSRRERTALNEMCEVLGGGMRAEEIKELWEECENNSSVEANLVKDFDKVEMILQALEYEDEVIMALQSMGRCWMSFSCQQQENFKLKLERAGQLR